MSEAFDDRTREKHLKSRIVGSLLGGAIGDALGYQIEFERGIKDKEYTTYANDWGIVSDDTQMTLYTANALIWRETRLAMRGIAMPPVNAVYYGYIDWLRTQNVEVESDSPRICWISDIEELNHRRAPGMTCISALSSGRMGTLEVPINNSKGCGGVMRVAPLGLYMRDAVYAGRFAADASAITHGHPLGNIPSYVLGAMLYYIVREENTIADALDKTMTQLREEIETYEFSKSDLDVFTALINKVIELSKRTDILDIDAIRELGEGWVAEEALAIAVYACLKHSDNFKDAIVCASNQDGDSDSTGAIAGNIIGAALGVEAIPDYYIEHLEMADKIRELAEDLATEVPVSEYNPDNDEKWLQKYMYVKSVES